MRFLFILIHVFALPAIALSGEQDIETAKRILFSRANERRTDLTQHVRKLDSASEVPTLLKILTKPGSYPVPKLKWFADGARTEAAWILCNYRQTGNTDSVLRDLLKNDDSTAVRATIAYRLVETGAELTDDELSEVIPFLVDNIRTDRCFDTLRKMKSLNSVSHLIETLTSDVEVSSRARAAFVLGEIKAVSAVPPLIAALQEYGDEANYWKYYRLRMFAGSALGKIGDQRAVEPLMSGLEKGRKDDPQHHGNAFMMVAIVEALGKLRNPKSTSILISVLRDDSLWSSNAAANALGEIGDVSAVPALIDRVNTQEWWYDRKPAVRALGILGDPRAIPTLESIKAEALMEVTNRAIDQIKNRKAKNKGTHLNIDIEVRPLILACVPLFLPETSYRSLLRCVPILFGTRFAHEQPGKLGELIRLAPSLTSVDTAEHGRSQRSEDRF